jgi:hypothetical protein
MQRVCQSRPSFSFRLLSFFFRRFVFSKMDFARRVTIWIYQLLRKRLWNWTGTITCERSVFILSKNFVRKLLVGLGRSWKWTTACSQKLGLPTRLLVLVESVSRAPYWYCPKSGCEGNWLDGSKLEFLTIVRFVYFWCEEILGLILLLRAHIYSGTTKKKQNGGWLFLNEKYQRRNIRNYERKFWVIFNVI